MYIHRHIVAHTIQSCGQHTIFPLLLNTHSTSEGTQRTKDTTTCVLQNYYMYMYMYIYMTFIVIACLLILVSPTWCDRGEDMLSGLFHTPLILPSSLSVKFLSSPEVMRNTSIELVASPDQRVS